jgi:hypothetical protein
MQRHAEGPVPFARAVFAVPTQGLPSQTQQMTLRKRIELFWRAKRQFDHGISDAIDTPENCP